MVTERRKKWEESLPERNKVLRLQLQVLKDSIKLELVKNKEGEYETQESVEANK